jgi:hypothetical protein
LRDRARLYAVVVDGESVASLREGEVRDIRLSPGTHEVWIKIDWTRSRKLQIDLTEGERVTLQCKAGGGPMMSLFDAVLRSRRYIDIRQAREASGDVGVGPYEQPLADISGTHIGSTLLVLLGVAVVALALMIAFKVPAWVAATVVGFLVFFGSMGHCGARFT